MHKKPLLPLQFLKMAFRLLPKKATRSTSQLIILSQRPLPTNREEWRAYWQAQGQPWRTEPEIDSKRQEYLVERCAILPDIEKSINPFREVKLNRADIEWLLAIHEKGREPVDWNEWHQVNRDRLDLWGADLCQVDLSRLPFTRLLGVADSLQRGVWLLRSNVIKRQYCLKMRICEKRT